MGQVRFSARVAGLSVLALGAALAMPAAARAADAPKATPTFTKDIAPIFQEKCEACHRPDSMAPMSLKTYAQTRPWGLPSAALPVAGSSRRILPNGLSVTSCAFGDTWLSPMLAHSIPSGPIWSWPP